MSPDGDEREPDGTRRTQAEAAAHVEKMLKNQVKEVTEAVQAESPGTTPATPPDKARVQQAWDATMNPLQRRAHLQITPCLALVAIQANRLIVALER